MKLKRSKTLTTICLGFTLFLIPVLAVLVFTLPMLLDRYYELTVVFNAAEIIHRILIAFYICVPIGFAALILLAKILLNIRREKLFIRQNAVCFRWLSVCALYVGVACICTGIVYVPLLLIAVAALFIGLLLQVLVRLLLTACEISEENQLTI